MNNKAKKKFKFDRKFWTRAMCLLLVILTAVPYLVNAFIY